MTTTAELAAVTDADFAQEVLASPIPALVEFTTSWCAPCRVLLPVLTQLAAEHAGSVKVRTMDVAANPRTAADYAVHAMPTLIVFSGGEPVVSLVGAVTKARLQEHFGAVLWPGDHG